ncbi:MAG: class I SAM-dependent methyltransferase [Gammaproteobacteria bacterium]
MLVEEVPRSGKSGPDCGWKMNDVYAEMLPARLGKKQIVSAYRRIAPIYDVWGRLTESRAQDLCLEWAGIADGEDVLDVAVGSGLLFRRLLALNPSGYCAGLDLSEAMLRRARSKAEAWPRQNWELVQGDAYALPWPAGRFDVVVNNYMFDLLPQSDFDQVLSEFKRVLKPGGRLAMVNMTGPESRVQAIWSWVYQVSPGLLGGCRGVHLLPWLERAGFTDTRRQFVSQSTFPSEVVLARLPLATVANPE